MGGAGWGGTPTIVPASRVLWHCRAGTYYSRNGEIAGTTRILYESLEADRRRVSLKREDEEMLLRLFRSHPWTSYVVLSEDGWCSSIVAVRQTSPAGPPKARLLDRVGAALCTPHDLHGKGHPAEIVL